jgi:DNA-binding MarR family transcriptional regulator
VADQTLEPLGLDVRQYGTLMVLGSEGPLSQQTVGELLPCDRTTMVSLVDALEAKGYVERRRNPVDRRAYALQITPKGRRVVGRASELMEGAEGELLDRLSETERRRLKQLLRKLLLA